MSVTWHKLSLPTFPSNNLCDHEVAGKTVCLVKKEDKIYAVAQKCPHSGAIMSEGWLDARGYLVCPLHKYLFDVKNGRNVSGEGYVLKRWPLEEREDGLYLGLESVADAGPG
ncbi:MAG: Rieske 2Fe-2S domain-containing protein [Chitinophagaceae bacterium]